MSTSSTLTVRETVDLLLSLRDRAAESLLIFAIDEKGRPLPRQASIINQVPWGSSFQQRAVAFAWLSRFRYPRVVLAFGHPQGGASALDAQWAASATAALGLFGMNVASVWVATCEEIVEITPGLARAA